MTRDRKQCDSLRILSPSLSTIGLLLLVTGIALAAPAAAVPAEAGAVETVAVAGPSACICRCNVQDGYDWEWGYYEPDANGSCEINCENCCVLNGQLGDLEMCRKVPRPIQTSAQTREALELIEEFLRWLATPPEDE